ncbi:MAG TPA: hypothetical protein VGB55_09935, partial [Tepidisphaeraceae bacterium]
MARLVLTLLGLVVLGNAAVLHAADKPAERPGLALKFDVDGGQAKLVVAFDYLRGVQDRPRFEGVRRYTYDVALGRAPVRVGWKGERLLTVLLDGVNYSYAPGSVDRQENGSVSIAPADEKAGTFRIRGVYHYADQLFVIDAVVKAGDVVLL